MLLVRRRHDEMPEDMFGFKSRSEDFNRVNKPWVFGRTYVGLSAFLE